MRVGSRGEVNIMGGYRKNVRRKLTDDTNEEKLMETIEEYIDELERELTAEAMRYLDVIAFGPEEEEEDKKLYLAFLNEKLFEPHRLYPLYRSTAEVIIEIIEAGLAIEPSEETQIPFRVLTQEEFTEYFNKHPSYREKIRESQELARKLVRVLSGLDRFDNGELERLKDILNRYKLRWELVYRDGEFRVFSYPDIYQDPLSLWADHLILQIIVTVFGRGILIRKCAAWDCPVYFIPTRSDQIYHTPNCAKRAWKHRRKAGKWEEVASARKGKGKRTIRRCQTQETST